MPSTMYYLFLRQRRRAVCYVATCAQVFAFCFGNICCWQQKSKETDSITSNDFYKIYETNDQTYTDTIRNIQSISKVYQSICKYAIRSNV